MTKTIMIAMPTGGLLAAVAMGRSKDVAVDPHQAIAVPAAYAETLIHNRFAYEVTEAEADDSKAEVGGKKPRKGKKVKEAEGSTPPGAELSSAGTILPPGVAMDADEPDANDHDADDADQDQDDPDADEKQDGDEQGEA